MVGEGSGTAGESYSERSSLARVRASRKAQANSSSGVSPMIQRQPLNQQNVMNCQSIPPPPPLPEAATASSGSHKSQKRNQDKALVKLLAEMRDLEKKMNTQAAEYAVERKQLQNTVHQQQQEIISLKQSNHELAVSKKQAEHTLRKVLTQLDRFSTGCWQFPSNSVKKMSEALHTQLQEWKRTINEEELSPEDEYLEKSTMEKMQQLHLEVKQLRAENRTLKKDVKEDVRHSSKKSGHRSATKQTSSSRCGVVTDDEASNLSGMSSTILSGMLESPKMDKAMNGFLNSPTKSRASTRREKGSPRSILKQSGRYESRQDDNILRRGGGYKQRAKSVPSLPPRLPHGKVARFAGVDDPELDCDWGDTEHEV